MPDTACLRKAPLQYALLTVHCIAEWYFRSGLDRYVWIFGMFVAWIHPQIEAAFKAIEALRPSLRYAAQALISAALCVAAHQW